MIAVLLVGTSNFEIAGTQLLRSGPAMSDRVKTTHPFRELRTAREIPVPRPYSSISLTIRALRSDSYC